MRDLITHPNYLAALDALRTTLERGRVIPPQQGEFVMPPKKPVNETTSPKVASKAAKLLSNPKTSKTVKSVAGSALAQAANKPKKGR